MDWKKTTLENYDKHAGSFDSFSTIFRGKMERWINYYASQLSEGAKILDIGCGAGRDALYLSNQGLKVTGIDYSENLISIAKNKVPGAKFLVMDFEEIAFAEKSFDGVWANACLLHLPKNRLLPVLEKIYAILKDTSLLFASFRVGEGERFTLEKRGNAELKRFYSYYQPQELKQKLKEAGFNNVKVELDTIETGDSVAFFARK